MQGEGHLTEGHSHGLLPLISQADNIIVSFTSVCSVCIVASILYST